MYIAIHDKETTYIGMTIKDDSITFSEEDYVSEENIPITSGKPGEGVMVAIDRISAASDLILRHATKLSGPINIERVDEIKSMIRKCHEEYNQMNKEGVYNTCVIIGTQDGLYEIYRQQISRSDFIASRWTTTSKGAYLTSEGKPTIERLLYIYRTIERLENVVLFPISIYDVRTGKRKIYYK